MGNAYLFNIASNSGGNANGIDLSSSNYIEFWQTSGQNMTSGNQTEINHGTAAIDHNELFTIDRTPDTPGGGEVFQNVFYTGNTTNGHFELLGLSNVSYVDPTTGSTITLSSPGAITYAIVVDPSTGDKYAMMFFGNDAASDWFSNLIDTIPFGATANLNAGGFASYIATSKTTSLICFCAGTMIRTEHGEKAVEDIAPGDRVETVDRGLQTIRWTHSSHVQFGDTDDKHRPICISAGSLGFGIPKHDLLVSPQHRMMVSSVIAQRVTGQTEVLVAAKKLLELPGVFVEETVTETEYWHFFCDQHEVVFAEGAPSETLHLGKEALKALTDEEVEELEALFPEALKQAENAAFARPVASGKEAKNIAARHVKNNKPVLAAYAA